MAQKKNAPETESKKLYKSRIDKMIDGVCAGFAAYFNIDVTTVRVIWVLSIFAGGLGIWAYLASVFIIPAQPENEESMKVEKVKHHPGLIWGVGLIVFGILLLSDHWHLFNPWRFEQHFHRWGTGFLEFDEILPFLILAAGIIYILYTLKSKNASQENKTTENKNTKNSIFGNYRRNTENRWVAGILSGFAEHFKIDSMLLRIAFIAIALATHWLLFVIIYIGLWVTIPEKE